MTILSDMSIRIKVLIAPVIMILTLGVILFIAISGMENQRKVLTDVQEISFKKLQLVQEFITTSELVQSDVYRLSVLRFMQAPEIEISPASERLSVGLNNLTIINGEILTKWFWMKMKKRLARDEQVFKHLQTPGSAGCHGCFRKPFLWHSFGSIRCNLF